ncbi:MULTISPECIES: restriction endonuclease subunit S [Vibrio]|uniref:restriction endonuclease subunit S n=1 Tax=Vibrio TaxID=662 RepID=UPI000317499B|nr:restriction endonuclease subunit S [Vibrio tasmaniensis]OEF72405.1 restriction endonuclease subunit S [Vibrio tasmaniensis 1F-155]PMO78585.1 restriction endonuclease subunit S [Vibrio tasmaniensis]
MSFPESWVQTTVGTVVLDIQPGFAQKPGEKGEGTTQQIRTHNITPGGAITLEGIKHVTASDKEAARYSLSIGDVVFNNTNSEEWVGKSAVFDQVGEFVFSNHMTRLRVNPELVIPDYLASYLHFLWSMGYSKTRAKRWVSQAGIESNALASFKLPLPVNSEQQRIVQVLQQTDLIAKSKRSTNDKIDQLIRTVYWEYFGDWYQDDGLVDPIRIQDCVADSQYGVSEAMEETGTHAVLRMNSITTSGWIDLSNLKYASLSEKDIQATELMNGDLLFNRTNSKELVGKCALWRPVNGQFSYASYLVRLRLKPEMLPEYLWATLNSTYGKYRLFNSAKQAVSMANVSPTDLGRITVPLPPLELQEKFAKFVGTIEELRNQMIARMESFSDLSNLVLEQALIGGLTSRWRGEHAQELADEARKRNELFHEQGAKIVNTSANTLPTHKIQDETSTRKTQNRLQAELSEFQCKVLTSFTEYCQASGQPLIVEDHEVFTRFLDDDSVFERLQVFGHSLGNRVRRTLSQLAALGLIAKISLPKQSTETGELEYLKAFRPLRVEEFTRMSDAQQLRKALSSSEENTLYFQVYLDYETSSKAGADGMFQVISVMDDNDKDMTDLIDQGQHYASLEDLKRDIANELGVSGNLIKLGVV